MQATTKVFLYTLLSLGCMVGLTMLQARFLYGPPRAIAANEAAGESVITREARRVPISARPELTMPVDGVQPSQLIDTWGAARAQGRLHEGVDILAPAGTLVRSAAAGTVQKLFVSERGGVTLYALSEDGRYIFYYAHLRGYAPGVSEGDRLAPGQVIGYVGMTGNAPVPHLHLEIQRAPADGKWWRGEAFNPYPSLLAGRIIASPALSETR